METGEWRLGRRPALDGLRGVAVLLVVIAHSWDERLGAAGRVGVGIFFVLSGFLITALLLEEQERAGRIAVGAFFARRARRLLPALFAFLAAVAVVRAVTGYGPDWWSMTAAVLYVGNWLPALGHNLGLVIGHTWSLAVEEQFYLAWPLVILLARRVTWRAQAVILALLVLAAVAWRVVLYADAAVAYSYVGTDTNGAGLLLGALVALLARNTDLKPGPVMQGVAGAALLGLCLHAQGVLGWLLAPGLAPFPAAVLVLAAARSEGTRLPSWLRLVGQRSYGLYLWHAPLLLAVVPVLPMDRIPATVLMLGCSWLLALASWRIVETPALSLPSIRGSVLERAQSSAVPS